MMSAIENVVEDNIIIIPPEAIMGFFLIDIDVNQGSVKYLYKTSSVWAYQSISRPTHIPDEIHSYCDVNHEY